MPFPYLTPLKKWVVDILEEREKNPKSLTYKMPYAVLTSPALVVKDTIKTNTKERIEQLKNIINNTSSGNKQYYGCVITNTTKNSLNYQTGETVVGFDLNGNKIIVEGEVNRRVSTPIIESIEIDTDGANNTLKTAKIQIKCFTLKQLEMFELFYLKPGMNLFLEYGDSSLLRKKQTNPSYFTSVEEALVVNEKNYNQFVQEFSNYSAPTTEIINKAYKKAEKSYGTYDYIAGKVSDFSYSIDDNGIYDISLEISQGNQFSLSIAHNVGKSDTQGGSADKNTQKIDAFSQAKQQIIYDFDLNPKLFDSLINLLPDSGKNDIFNWGSRNEKQSDDLVSFEPYLSLRFILKVLASYSNIAVKEFEFEIPTYKVGQTSNVEFIPVRSSPLLLSSSETILFPGEVPILDAESKTSNVIVLKSDQKNIFKIGNYTFNQPKNTTIIGKTEDGKDLIISENRDEYRIANALNCFILYKEILQLWKKSYTRLDFIEQIIKVINENGYGLWDLKLSAPIEGKNRTIVDFKTNNNANLQIENNKIYRFKPGYINSIVKNFTFNMELSDLVAGRSVFNTYNIISEAITKSKEGNKVNFNDFLEEKVYKSVDMSQYTSSDGYYSINKVELQAVLENKDKIEKQFEAGVKPTQSQQNQNEADEQSTTKEAQREKLLRSKTKKFKQKKDDNDSFILVFNDKSTIIGQISKLIKDVSESPRSTLTPIQISITIDGLSGLSCGEYFNVDGVPETYNQDGVFQITNIKHSLNNDGWSTTIEAGWRIIR